MSKSAQNGRRKRIEKDIEELREDKRRLREDKKRLRDDKEKIREEKDRLREELQTLVDNHEKLEIAVEYLDNPSLDVYVGKERWEARYKALREEVDKLPLVLPDYIKKI